LCQHHAVFIPIALYYSLKSGIVIPPALFFLLSIALIIHGLLCLQMSRTFSKEEVQMANKHMKKCSSSLAIKEMQIKTTLRFYLMLVRIATIKSTTNKCW
jgi:hypothetical protein